MSTFLGGAHQGPTKFSGELIAAESVGSIFSDNNNILTLANVSLRSCIFGNFGCWLSLIREGRRMSFPPSYNIKNVSLDESELRFDARDYSLLLIDTHEELAAEFRAFLEDEGFTVKTLTDTTTAFEALSKVYFDVIICDFKVSEMASFNFFESIRSNPALPPEMRIPIIVITSCGEHVELSNLDTGADLFCQRGEAQDRLVSQIRSLVAGRMAYRTKHWS